MYTSSLQSQWFGPSWHPAFETFAMAKDMCSMGVVEVAKKVPKENAMDAIYGKTFLDDLQKSVITGVYKRQSSVATLPRTARAKRVCSAGGKRQKLQESLPM